MQFSISKQCSALSKFLGNIKFSVEKIWRCPESNPGLLDHKQECHPLCHAAPFLPESSSSNLVFSNYATGLLIVLQNVVRPTFRNLLLTPGLQCNTITYANYHDHFKYWILLHTYFQKRLIQNCFCTKS